MRERIIQLLAEIGMGQNTFERKVGWSIGGIAKMKHAPRADQLAGVIREFPTLNIKWLITGEGEMWEKPSQPSQAPQTNAISTEWLMARIEAQERLIEQLSSKDRDSRWTDGYSGMDTESKSSVLNDNNRASYGTKR